MDPGLRNVIETAQGNLYLTDYEHASGCAKEWDIERVLFQLPDRLKGKFEESYYQGEIADQVVRQVTRVVMVATFASKLPKKENSLTESCYRFVRNQLQVLQTVSEINGQIEIEEDDWLRWPTAVTMGV
jgi:hypothetical protein